MMATAAQAQETLVGPAPYGPPREVATAVIKAAGHPCERLLQAERTPTGGIRAICANGATFETYRIFTIQGEPVAMKCSAAARLGIPGC